jgi:hypothetical protein
LTGTDLNPLFQQMGEVLSGIESLRDTIRLRQSQADQLHEILRSDLASLRGDQGDLEEKLECVICVMQHDLEALRADTRENARALDHLVLAVQALRRPIADIAALRSRVAGVVFAIGVVGSMAIWLAEPVYRWAVEDHFGKR